VTTCEKMNSFRFTVCFTCLVVGRAYLSRNSILDAFDVTEDAEKREMSEALRSFFRD